MSHVFAGDLDVCSLGKRKSRSESFLVAILNRQKFSVKFSSGIILLKICTVCVCVYVKSLHSFTLMYTLILFLFLSWVDGVGVGTMDLVNILKGKCPRGFYPDLYHIYDLVFHTAGSPGLDPSSALYSVS